MAEPIIQINRLSHAYEEGTPAIHDVTFDIPDNAFLAIIGHNGAGKTTLVKHFNGLLKPSSGQVLVAGIDVASTSTAALAHLVGFVFQNPDHQIFSGTVQEEVAFGLRNLGIAPHEIEKRVCQILDELELEAFRDTPPAMLGYGLRRKITLAAVLAMDPRILVLDEPTVGLDAHSTNEFFNHINRMHQQGHSIILVTHDMRLAAHYSSSCLVMRQGCTIGYDSTRSIFGNSDLLACAGLAQPAITKLGSALQDVGMPANLLGIEEFADAYLHLSERAS